MPKPNKNSRVNKPKIYWSASRHRTSVECPRQFAFKYKMNMLYDQDETPFLYGSMMHKHLEGQDVSAELERVMTIMERPIELASDFEVHKVHAKEYLERLKVKKTDKKEYEFCTPIKYPSGRKPKFDIKVYGFIDRVISKDRIIEYKTSTAPYSPAMINNNDQFTFYLWQRWAETGRLHELFLLNFFKSSKSRKAGVQLKLVKRTLIDFEDLMERMEQQWGKCQKGDCMEKKESYNCRWCPFKDICSNFDL